MKYGSKTRRDKCALVLEIIKRQLAPRSPIPGYFKFSKKLNQNGSCIVYQMQLPDGIEIVVSFFKRIEKDFRGHDHSDINLLINTNKPFTVLASALIDSSIKYTEVSRLVNERIDFSNVRRVFVGDHYQSMVNRQTTLALNLALSKGGRNQ